TINRRKATFRKDTPFSRSMFDRRQSAPRPGREQRMATVVRERTGPLAALGQVTENALTALGDLTIFAGRTLAWTFRRRAAPRPLLSSFSSVGVRSVPVVAITGLFIGMVLAVQSFNQFHRIGLETRLGAIINISIVRELGPVLAATMLAGRVGS